MDAVYYLCTVAGIVEWLSTCNSKLAHSASHRTARLEWAFCFIFEGMILSEHFTLSELTRSATGARKGLDNTPPQEVIINLTSLCEKILEPLRAKIGKPLIVLSGYRSQAVNKAVGGAKNSQHLTGNACDFYVNGLTISELFELIRKSGLEYDQCLEEFGQWIHISWNGLNNRNQDLIVRKVNGKTVYTAPK